MRQRLDAIGKPVPEDGFHRGGYKLVYTDTPSDYQSTTEDQRKRIDLLNSIGIEIDAKDSSKDGMLTHRLVEGMKSDLLVCDVDESRAVACPMARGDVAFHHSRTPHMSNANNGTAWRKAITNHLQQADAGGEGDHYPWRVKVNQRTGERRNVADEPSKRN